MAEKQLTFEELGLLGLTRAEDLPKGGEVRAGRYFTGSGTSDDAYRPDVEKAIGCRLQKGTFNIRLTAGVVLAQPIAIPVAGEEWHAVPVIIEESAVGVHAWRRVLHDDTFLEVFSPVSIAARLRIQADSPLSVRILNGNCLRSA